MAIKHRILFVCMGNICRSPMAEGVFQALVEKAGRAEEFEISSAGTGSWHLNASPDKRALKAAWARGYDITKLSGSTVKEDDFKKNDFIIAMDRSNIRDLMRRRPPHSLAQLHLLLEFAPDCPLEELPDPYFGKSEAFEDTLDLIERAAQGLLEHFTSRSEKSRPE